MTPDPRWTALRRWLRKEIAHARAVAASSRDPYTSVACRQAIVELHRTLAEMTRIARRRTRPPQPRSER